MAMAGTSGAGEGTSNPHYETSEWQNIFDTTKLATERPIVLKDYDTSNRQEPRVRGKLRNILSCFKPKVDEETPVVLPGRLVDRKMKGIITEEPVKVTTIVQVDRKMKGIVVEHPVDRKMKGIVIEEPSRKLVHSPDLDALVTFMEIGIIRTLKELQAEAEEKLICQFRQHAYKLLSRHGIPPPSGA